MGQGSRPDRVGEAIRQAVSVLIARDVQDPGIGFVTLTRVKVSPDLQMARVYYTQMGDDKEKRETARALERATPFMRRQLAGQLNLRRVPELRFQFDQSVEYQDRVERILLELDVERKAREGGDPGEGGEGGEGLASGEPGETATDDPGKDGAGS
jgi:ribosome-binding factor A